MTVSATINILTRSATQVAPEGFAFDITLDGFDTLGPQPGEVYDARLHDIYYFWDFGDPYNFTAPENIVPQFRNAGVGYGARVGHVYRTPGTYEVSCLVVEPSSGKRATATTTVTVGDPDEVFAARATIYVDQTYDGVNRPEGAPESAFVFPDFMTAFMNQLYNKAGPPRRVMLARGQTHKINREMMVGYTFVVPSFCVVAADGPGPKPIIDMTENGFFWHYEHPSASERDFRFENIEFYGGWDPTTQSGIRQIGFFFQANPPKQTLFESCTFDGFDLGLYPRSNSFDKISPDPFIFMNNSVVTNWRSCGIFGNGINLCLTGNRFAQNTEALNGYAGNEGSLVSAIRVSFMDNAILTQNDFFSRSGWFVNAPGIYTTQACMRLSTWASQGTYYNVNCNTMEGGFQLLTIANSEGQDGLALNAVVEKNLLIGSHDTKFIVDISYGGTTTRNNVGIYPNTPTFGIQPDRFVAFSRQGTDTNNTNAPQKVYSNTFVNLRTRDNAFDGEFWEAKVSDAAFAGYANAVESNNVNYQPGHGLIADGPLDQTVLFAPRYTHYEDDDTPRDTTKATPADTIALYQPLEGSAALGDALRGEVAFDDFFGNPRPVYPSRGAFEAT